MILHYLAVGIRSVIMRRPEYIDHVIAQKNSINVKHIEYMLHLESGDQLFAIYNVKGQSLKNETIDAEVISYFQFQDGKILKVHGQVRLTNGKYSDVDMQN